MKEVKIYIKTSLRGPSIRDGCYAAVVEYIAKSGAVIRKIHGKEKNTTYHRSVLIAAVESLKILNVPCDVTVYTDCIFIKNTVERGSPEAWRRSEWKRAAGGEVKNKELWQQFTEEMDKHKIGFRFSKHCVYSDLLDELLKQEEEEHGAGNDT